MSGSVVAGLVSTIVPVHDRPAMLADAVESVLAQRYRPIEVIVVDDGSTDDTGRVADALAAKSAGSVTAVHQANRGPGAAREAGRLLARGEFVQYLDSDDLLLPGKFEEQVAGLRGDAAAGVSYGKTAALRRGDGGELAALRRTGEMRDALFPSFLAERWWFTSTPLYRRSVTDAAGPWTDLWNEEDWEYDCRVAALGARLHWTGTFVSRHCLDGHERLSGRGADRRVLASRARAHELILGHARRFGIGADAPEMQRFARELFLLSRQCGAAGLAREAARLFDLARDASGPRRGGALQFRTYRAGAALIGWSGMGRLSALLDRARAGRRGGR
jgi:glycosyltransferase involved in cell wall biosynthesis